jgi:hypothetical protein
MLNDIIQNTTMKNKTVLFWNTFCYGTFEDTTRNVAYKDLPKSLHIYFEEDVQLLDSGL